MKRNIIGFFILAFIVLLLYSLVFYVLLSQRSAYSIVMVVGVVCLLYGLVTEWNLIKRDSKQADKLPMPKKTVRTFVSILQLHAKNIQIVLFVCCAAVLTYVLSVYLGLGPVVAAGFVGIAAGLLLPKFAAPIYCGAFVGMVGPQVLPLFYEVFFAGIIAGCVFVFATDVNNGFGGKLGTIAMAGCLTIMLITGNTPQTLSTPRWDISCIVIFCTAVSAVITYVLNTRILNNPVLASALVGLAGGLAMPHLNSEAGSLLAAAVICASFAGMSSQKRAGNEIAMVLTGILVGIVYVFAFPYFGGVGGKLGTIAFGSVIIVRGFIDGYNTIKSKFNKKTPQYELFVSEKDVE